MTFSLRQRLQDALPHAMRARDTTRVSVLRTTLAAIANAESVDASDSSAWSTGVGANDVARRELGDDDVRAIVEIERDDLRSTSDELRGLGRDAEAEDLAMKADVLDEYLTT